MRFYSLLFFSALGAMLICSDQALAQYSSGSAESYSSSGYSIPNGEDRIEVEIYYEGVTTTTVESVVASTLEAGGIWNDEHIASFEVSHVGNRQLSLSIESSHLAQSDLLIIRFQDTCGVTLLSRSQDETNEFPGTVMVALSNGDCDTVNVPDINWPSGKDEVTSSPWTDNDSEEETYQKDKAVKTLLVKMGVKRSVAKNVCDFACPGDEECLASNIISSDGGDTVDKSVERAPNMEDGVDKAPDDYRFRVKKIGDGPIYWDGQIYCICGKSYS